MQDFLIDVKVWIKFWLALFIFQEVVNAVG